MNGYQFKIEITARMIHEFGLKGVDLLVFALLDHYTKLNGECHYSAASIAEMLNMAKTTVCSCVSNLEMNGLISRKKVFDKDNHIGTIIKTIK